MAMPSKKHAKKLRILCLHGYRQNGQIFRERTGAFRKLIKKHAELVFITAPNVVPAQAAKLGDVVEENPPEDVRGWWFSKEDKSYIAQDKTMCCQGYEASLDVIKATFQELGQFDGILSFSQGASLLTLVCSLRETNPDSYPFNFAIFVAGFKSRSGPHANLYRTTVTIPTLHVFGDTDAVIPKGMSQDILPLYIEPMILRHPGGHFLPASSREKPVYIDFLNKMLALKK